MDNTQDQRLATADETTPAGGIASPLRTLVMPHHIEGEEMVDNEKTLKAAMAENIATVLAAALCVGLVAIGTGSLHCLWGLLILVNLNAWRATTKAEPVILRNRITSLDKRNRACDCDRA